MIRFTCWLEQQRVFGVPRGFPTSLSTCNSNQFEILNLPWCWLNPLAHWKKSLTKIDQHHNRPDGKYRSHGGITGAILRSTWWESVSPFRFSWRCNDKANFQMLHLKINLNMHPKYYQLSLSLSILHLGSLFVHPEGTLWRVPIRGPGRLRR